MSSGPSKIVVLPFISISSLSLDSRAGKLRSGSGSWSRSGRSLASLKATSSKFRDACLLDPHLEHSLVVKRFPLLAAVMDAQPAPLDASASLVPRELFRTYARFFGGAADEEAPAPTDDAGVVAPALDPGEAAVPEPPEE